jgi:hypothetical protein
MIYAFNPITGDLDYAGSSRAEVQAWLDEAFCKPHLAAYAAMYYRKGLYVVEAESLREARAQLNKECDKIMPGAASEVGKLKSKR